MFFIKRKRALWERPALSITHELAASGIPSDPHQVEWAGPHSHSYIEPGMPKQFIWHDTPPLKVCTDYEKYSNAKR
jgi:hypothetical protein